MYAWERVTDTVIVVEIDDKRYLRTGNNVRPVLYWNTPVVSSSIPSWQSPRVHAIQAWYYYGIQIQGFYKIFYYKRDRSIRTYVFSLK